MKKFIIIFSVFIAAFLYFYQPSSNVYGEGIGGNKKQNKTKCSAPYEKYYKIDCDGTGSYCAYAQSCPDSPE
jgi:hypothetical protein